MDESGFEYGDMVNEVEQYTVECIACAFSNVCNGKASTVFIVIIVIDGVILSIGASRIAVVGGAVLGDDMSALSLSRSNEF